MDQDDLETLKNEAKWMSQTTREYGSILKALKIIHKMGQESAERKSQTIKEIEAKLEVVLS